jgi:hypothetical protein
LELIDWGVGGIPARVPLGDGRYNVSSLRVNGECIEDVLRYNERCIYKYNGIYYYDESKVTGSLDDIQAGDTVSTTGARFRDSEITWDELGSREVVINYFCRTCRTSRAPPEVNNSKRFPPGSSGLVCKFSSTLRTTRGAEADEGKFNEGAGNFGPCTTIPETVFTVTPKHITMTTLEVRNSRPMGTNHIGLFIGDGFVIDGVEGGGDTITTGDFIYSTSPQVQHTNLRTRYTDNRIVYVGRPIDVPAWRRAQ